MRHDRVGARLLRLASHISSPSTVRLVLEPLVADWRHELQSARKSNWTELSSGYAAFWTSFLLRMPRDLLEASREVASLKDFVLGGWRPALLTALALIAVVAATSSHDGWETGAIWLVPGFVTMAIPFAVLAGTAYNQHEAGDNGRAAVVMGVLSVAVMLALVGWVTPATNQLFRLAVYATQGGHDVLPRGPSELNLLELIEQPDESPKSRSPRDCPLRLAPARRSNTLHSRLSLTFVAFPFVLLGIGLRNSIASRLKRLGVIVGITGLYFLSWAVLWDATAGRAPAWSVLFWLPTAIWFALGIVLLMYSDGRRLGSLERPVS